MEHIWTWIGPVGMENGCVCVCVRFGWWTNKRKPIYQIDVRCFLIPSFHHTVVDIVFCWPLKNKNQKLGQQTEIKEKKFLANKTGMDWNEHFLDQIINSIQLNLIQFNSIQVNSLI